ncbi:hypothetical protein V8B55DRAFT_1442645 [Mucor lusitanicus]
MLYCREQSFSKNSEQLLASTTLASERPTPPTSEPAIPATSEPAIPATSEPAIPATSEPAIPATSEPAIPATSEPAIPATSEPAIPASSEPTLFINNEDDLGHYLVDDFDVTAIFRRYQIHSDKIAKPIMRESNIQELLALGDVLFLARKTNTAIR